MAIVNVFELTENGRLIRINVQGDLIPKRRMKYNKKQQRNLLTLQQHLGLRIVSWASLCFRPS
jgi:hypothetical protein